MKLRLLSIASAISLLFSVWVGLRTFQASRDCFQSSLIDHVLFDRAGGIAEAKHCDRQDYLRFWEFTRISDEDRSLIRRIEVLERLRMMGLKAARTRVELVITENEPMKLQWTDRRLVLGSEWVKSRGQLERVLLQRWVREQVAILGQDVFQHEVLSYLLVGFLNDELILGDPWLGGQTNLADRGKWLGWVRGIGDYCFGAWVAIDHLGFCTNFKQVPVKQRDVLATLSEIEKLSLAPLVAGVIWSRYKQGSLSERSQFWSGIGASLTDHGVLSRWQWEAFVPPQRVSDLVKWLNNTADVYWSSFGFVEGLHREWIAADFDVVIESPSNMRLSQAGLVGLDSAGSGRSIVIREGHRTRVDELRWISLELDEFRTRAQVVVACQALASKDFINSDSSKVVVVDVCQSPQPIRWQGLVRGGIDEFVQQNPEMVFAALFMPAVKQVSAWPIQFKFDAENFRDLAGILKWQAEPWDDRLMAIRPLGVWDAVLFYRL